MQGMGAHNFLPMSNGAGVSSASFATLKGRGMFGAYWIAPMAVLALAGCDEASSLPVQSDSDIARGVDAVLAGCTGPLAPDGNIGEASLRAAQWVPIKRVQTDVVDNGTTISAVDKQVPVDTPSTLAADRQSESSEWTHSGIVGTLYLTRFGGAVGVQNVGECTMAFRGKGKATAEAIRKQLVSKYGAPQRVGTRSSGGDHLTPRFGEGEIHAQYWQRLTHDIYWVSDASNAASVEVVAMPDRAKLDPTSSGNPQFRVYIAEPKQ